MISELKYWKTDIPSGLIVFLVAIPLCLGIALASGAPALSGVIAGIVGGLIVTCFSNSSLGVSGPAAGLVAIVEPAIQQLGFQNFLLAVVLAGVFQFLLGFYKAGTIGYYFPTAVIKGMLVAIGLIIILKQIPHAFGYDKDYEGDLAYQQADGFNTFSEIWHAIELVTPTAVIITLVCLGILILWESRSMKRFSFTKIIQGPLVAVVAGIVLNLCFTGSMKLEKEHLVSLPESIELTYPHFKPSKVKSTEINLGHGGGGKHENESEGTESTDAGSDTAADTSEKGAETDDQTAAVTPFGAGFSILICGLTLAVVASLESLLCAEATDKLDPQRRQTDLNKELKAQGIGNFVSGLIGGLPVTQVIVRSSTNIQSGAQSRLASVRSRTVLDCLRHRDTPCAKHDSAGKSGGDPVYRWLQTCPSDKVHKHVQARLDTVFTLHHYDCSDHENRSPDRHRHRFGCLALLHIEGQLRQIRLDVRVGRRGSKGAPHDAGRTCFLYQQGQYPNRVTES